MTLRAIALSALLLFSATTLNAQNGLVNVNYATGSPVVSIPIQSIAKGQVAVTLSLSYGSNGTRPKDVEATAGVGWQINAGGSVSRRIHGLPDDLEDNVNSPVLKGWMSSTGASAISGFTIANDNNPATCTDENADLSYINTSLPFNQDTEPDDFFVSAPGLSCRLVYDKATSKFRAVSYEDLVITYTTTGGTGNKASLISSFTIKNDRGLTYVFSAPESLNQKIVGTTTPAFFRTKYQQYQNGVYCYTGWNLTKVTDASGAGILLNYTQAEPRFSTDKVNLYISGSTTASNLYAVSNTVVNQVLTTLTTTDTGVDGAPLVSLHWKALNTPGYSGQTIIDYIISLDRTYFFTYYNATYGSTTRNFLKSITDRPQAELSPFNYQFTYGGLDAVTSSLLLPDSTSKNIDYWGYYAPGSNTSLIPKVRINPSNNALPRYSNYNSQNGGGSYTFSTTNGNDRSAGSTNFDYGALATVTNGGGGRTTIVYEPNDYLDVPSNQTIRGGGIRVKQLIEYDGMSTGNNIVKDYGYRTSQLVTGKSTGRPVTMPVYAFTSPYTGSATGQAYWNTVSVLSDEDLSEEDHSILYNSVRVAHDNGSTVYEYSNPGTYWDNNVAPSCNGCTAEWQQTVDLVARIGCTTSSWAVKNDAYAYPFLPNPNYDFERGLIKKETNYDQDDVAVSETNYQYQRSFTPLVIEGFRSDYNSALARSYNKYKIYYNTSELVSQVSQTIYSAAASRTTTTMNSYSSANHKLLTKQSLVNSDNSTVNTYFTYTKDYPASGSNPNISAISNMKLANINAQVETYKQVVRSGTKTTEASLTLYTPVTSGSTTMYLPSRDMRLVQPAGITDFTPFNVTGGTPNYDARYFAVRGYRFYDETGMAQTIDDTKKNVQTVLTDQFTVKPVAAFGNAAFDEIGFINFESEIVKPYNFTFTGTSSYNGAGHTGLGLNIISSQVFSKTVTRNPIVSKYIFSIWLNASSSGSLSIKVNGTAAGSISYAANSKWTYYETSLPVTGLSPGFTVSFSSSQAIVIDDLLLYPDIAQAATASYTKYSGFKTSETNTTGISAYYDNDDWGRNTFVYDQDKNILQKNTYVTVQDVKNFNAAGISYSLGTLGTPNIFSVSVSYQAVSGTTISWNFGDGGTGSSNAGEQIAHTYAATGTYHVTATVSSSFFGTKTMTADVPVTNSGGGVIPEIPLAYSNTAAVQSDVTLIRFVPVTTGPTREFTLSQLLGGAYIQKRAYNVTVYLSGARPYDGDRGYRSIALNGDCRAFDPSNTYSYTKDFSSASSATISVTLNTCP